MNPKINILLVLSLTLLAGCVKESLYDGSQSGDRSASESFEQGWVRIKVDRVAGELDILTFTRDGSGSGIAAFDAAATRAGTSEIRRVFSDGDRFRERRRRAGLHLWYDVRVREDIPLAEAVAGFKEVAELEVVEPIGRIVQTDGQVARWTKAGVPQGAFNDPLFSQQWMYRNDGSIAGSVAGADLNLTPAWTACTGHRDVIVAIFDGGIQSDHPDLAANMWRDAQGRCGYNFNRNSYDIIPGDHGTHVAGTIAAVNNNGVGVCGIAGGDGSPGSGVRLMCCQVMDEVGYPNLLEAMTYAADNGAVISQNSWMRGGSSISTADKAAIDYFIQNAGFDEHGVQTGPMAGGLVVFAAGNDNTSTPAYPPAYEKVIAVGSISANFAKTFSSNYGAWIDLMAPGDKVMSTVTGGTYGSASGTSMAAPMVSGVAALAVAKYGTQGPGFTSQMLWELLISSGRRELVESYNLPQYAGMLGAGLVDAEYVMFRDAIPAKVDALAALGRRYHVELQWKVPESYAGRPVSGFEIFVDTQPFTNFDYGNIPPAARKYEIANSLAVGKVTGCEVEASEPSTDYYFAVVAKTRYGTASQPVFITASASFNTAPEVVKLLSNRHIPRTGTAGVVTIDLSEYFRDVDAPFDRLSYLVNYSVDGVVECLTEGAKLVITPRATGMVRLTVIAEDRDGKSVESSFDVMVVGTGAAIDLYPNPFRDQLNVRIPDASGAFRVTMYDQAGQKALDLYVNVAPGSDGKINTSKLSPGNYTFVLSGYGDDITRNAVKRP
ncbi:hypothetical protein FACS1894159_09550 [Bacteroidia bacterium]|nr:hypothetical protein FACS1894159_09550 [Bacteroidia bacterium]